MGLAAEGPREDAACLPCHAAAAPGTASRQALVHPGPATTLPAPTTLPVSEVDDKVMIACRTCHDPHRDARGGGPAAVLLRITEGGGQALCLDCHEQMVGINSIGHAAPFLQAAGFQTAGCQPCHVVHDDPRRVHGRYLYSEVLLSRARSSPSNFVADRYCVSCHREGGPVQPPRVATHPAVAMFNLNQPGQPGFLPLFDEQGRVDPNGTMSCRTCHVTHGRTKPAELGENVFSLDVRELQARQWHLRTYEPGSFCANCHGEDGLYRFLYFHDPQRRAMGIMVGPAAPGGPER
jgi:predicted CXXCH cytochrome family protein